MEGHAPLSTVAQLVHTVTFQWVPFNRGLAENELADADGDAAHEAAATATSLVTQDVNGPVRTFAISIATTL